jgi:hypothetical protein
MMGRREEKESHKPSRQGMAAAAAPADPCWQHSGWVRQQAGVDSRLRCLACTVADAAIIKNRQTCTRRKTRRARRLPATMISVLFG